MDFFQAAHGANRETKAFLGCIAALQEALGHENDASVTAPLLSVLKREQVDHGVHRAIGAVMGWQACDRLGQAKILNKQWRQFKATAPFWSTW